METAPSSSAPAAKKKNPIWKVAGLFAVALIYLIVSAPRSTTVPSAVVDQAISQSKGLFAALSKYATDHAGKYPDGKTSTEVFQQLVDQGYLTDPSLLYYPMAGKVAPTSKQLAPENICWDVTCCVDGDAPALLPVVFSTGYNVIYRSDVVQLMPVRTWIQWLTDHTYARAFYAACDHAGNTRSIMTSFGSEVQFMPAGIDLGNRAYHQLTPDGTVPPH